MVNFCRRFIPSVARIMAPLFSALLGKASVPELLVCVKDLLKAFQDAMAALIRSSLLAHPRKKALIALTTEASGEAVGAVLQQLVHGDWNRSHLLASNFAWQKESTVL